MLFRVISDIRALRLASALLNVAETNNLVCPTKLTGLNRIYRYIEHHPIGAVDGRPSAVRSAAIQFNQFNGRKKVGLSIPHLLVVLAIVVLVFGTKRLKSVGSDLGDAIKGFRNAVKEGEETNAIAVIDAENLAADLAVDREKAKL